MGAQEWRKLAPNIRAQFKDKLAECLNHPHVASAKLHGLPDCYKIKLRAAGYRLVYRVDDRTVIVTVIAVGKRDRGLVYLHAHLRTKD